MNDTSRPHVQIYTDGACSGNPGPGGWGVILRFGEVEKELKGGERDTTNNRMELMAAISGLEALKKPAVVDLTTDSQYVRQGITSWIFNWKKNGWRTSDKKPVKNVDLWQRLDAALRQHEVRWHWVKGHAGHVENERADELAREGMAPFKKKGRISPLAGEMSAKPTEGVGSGSARPAKPASASPKPAAPSAPAKPAKPRPRRSTQSY